MHRRTLILGLVTALTGCFTPRRLPEKGSLLKAAATRDVMVVVADMSGSYVEVMRREGWPFMTTLLKNFRRDLAGEEGTKVILAQISGETQGPIFDGSLKSFGKRIRGASDFQALLRATSQRGGSRVFDSIRQTVEYATQFVSEDTRAGVFVLSDMDDNLGGPGAEERLVAAFAAFGRKGGSVGLYGVDIDKVEKWRANLVRAGVKNFVVEASIAADPTFPSYER